MAHALRYSIVGLIVLLDQFTKIWADTALEMYQRIPITGFFNITKAYNYGAAFSFLDNEGGWQRWFFTVISLVVSAVLGIWLYRMKRSEKWLSLAIALILGGAVGNLIDRVWYGYVVDFIQVYWKDSYFPSFNVADAAISCGTVLLLILTLFEKSEPSADKVRTEDQ
ncbi:MAG: lipoprotein signal peptidase [Granulosicoccus sp.]|nr:lipoprotein signal peptidase [Granulosicoccus sp.]